jgi:hypothetical protein
VAFGALRFHKRCEVPPVYSPTPQTTAVEIKAHSVLGPHQATNVGLESFVFAVQELQPGVTSVVASERDIILYLRPPRLEIGTDEL